MKILKAVSAVTALSMTVTGLAVAASANSASSDDIANALGKLTRYGIVAETMETYSHFESNFAVKKLTLNNNFDLNNAVSHTNRTIRFTIKTEESFSGGEIKEYYFGVFCGGEIVGDPICVSFDREGTKTFVISVPEEYKYKDLVVHQLELVPGDDGSTAFAVVNNGTEFYSNAEDESEMLYQFGTCVIADELNVNNPEAFSSDKRIYVGADIWERLKKENDGRWFYGMPVVQQEKVTDKDGIASYTDTFKVDAEGKTVYQYGGAPIANASNIFIKDDNASGKVDDLLENIRTASRTLASYNGGSGKVIYLEFSGSIDSDTEQSRKILRCYEFLRNNPDYSMLVNVKINPGENSFTFNNARPWDAYTASRVVFNFYGNTNPENAHITIGDGFLGTIVAPDARVSNASTFCGAVYTPYMRISNGEPHMATYNTLSHSYSAVFDDGKNDTAVSSDETTPEEDSTSVPDVTTESDDDDVKTSASENVTTDGDKTTSATYGEETEELVTSPSETVGNVTTTDFENDFTTENSSPATETGASSTPAEAVTSTSPAGSESPDITTANDVTTSNDPVQTTTVTSIDESDDVNTSVPEPVETSVSVSDAITGTDVSIDESEDINTSLPSATTVPEGNVTSVPDGEITVPTENVTQPEEKPALTTMPEEAPEVTTTIIIIEIDEEVPRDLITIDEDVPLGDLPPSTGVRSHIGVFAVVGGAALAIGVGAQVYSVLLKKKS